MPRCSRVRILQHGTWLLAGLLLVTGCGEPADDDAFVARVGDEVLTEADVTGALAAVPPSLDLETARAQYVEQWITGQLLAREARRRGLLEEPDVQRQLRENERNVLASALLRVIYDEDSATFSRAELEGYLERNRDRMLLREPYVRVRFIEARTEGDAQAARSELMALYATGHAAATQDSLFAETARRFTVDTTAALALANSFVPQSRLARQTGVASWGVVAQMGPRETSQIALTADSTYFVVQLVDRVQAGGEPRLEWVADEVSRRLAIQARQQTVAREVQRLRAEALARGDLSVAAPEP